MWRESFCNDNASKKRDAASIKVAPKKLLSEPVVTDKERKEKKLTSPVIIFGTIIDSPHKYKRIFKRSKAKTDGHQNTFQI